VFFLRFALQCSRLCDGGIQTKSVSCVDSKTEEIVPDQQCDIISKPNAIDRCNTHACINWETSPWTKVSKKNIQNSSLSTLVLRSSE